MGEGNRRHELSIHGPSSDRHACVQFRPNQKLPTAEAGKAGLRSNQPSELGARFSGRPATSKTTQNPSLHTSVASASPTNCLQSQSHGRGFARFEAAARGWGESSWGGKFEGVKDGGSFAWADRFLLLSLFCSNKSIRGLVTFSAFGYRVSDSYVHRSPKDEVDLPSRHPSRAKF